MGFGLAKTVVIFPLNRRMVLTGMFEGEDRVIRVNAYDVAIHNRYVIMAAQRQMYSFDGSFRYLEPPIGMKSAADLLRDRSFVGVS